MFWSILQGVGSIVLILSLHTGHWELKSSTSSIHLKQNVCPQGVEVGIAKY